MRNDIAIKVENLSKRYRIGLEEEVPDTMAGALLNFLKQPGRNLRRLRRLTRFSDNGQRPGDEPEDVIWALKDVSFEVRRGEVVGIIGRNGAGKSTLLKILSRITHPTSGRIELKGRVSSLLEVGTGFHQELTGRENVYLNGTILGMTKAEVDRKFDEIVAFSGVEKFIDTPVKRYSSGMKVRLAFSVAAHLEPEILLVDEVLAVGDLAFQKKCLGKMEDVSTQGRTVLFVSHNMSMIYNLCPRCLLLEDNELSFDDATDIVVSKYINATSAREESLSLAHRKERTGTGAFRFTHIEFHGAKDASSADEGGEIRVGAPLTMRLYYEFLEYNPDVEITIAILFKDMFGRKIFTLDTKQSRRKPIINLDVEGVIVCTVSSLPLAPGEYIINLHAAVSRVKADNIEDAAMIEVQPHDYFETGRLPNIKKHGPFIVEHYWEMEKGESTA